MFCFSKNLRKGSLFFLNNIICLVEFSNGRNFATEIAKKGYARYKQTSLFLLSLALSLHRKPKEITNN